MDRIIKKKRRNLKQILLILAAVLGLLLLYYQLFFTEPEQAVQLKNEELNAERNHSQQLKSKDQILVLPALPTAARQLNNPDRSMMAIC